MEEADTSIDIAIRCVDAVEVEWMSKACYTGFITKIYKSRSIADPRNPVDRCHSECVGKEGRSTTGTSVSSSYALPDKRVGGKPAPLSWSYFSVWFLRITRPKNKMLKEEVRPGDNFQRTKDILSMSDVFLKVICKDELSSHNNFFSRAADWVALLKPFGQ